MNKKNIIVFAIIIIILLAGILGYFFYLKSRPMETKALKINDINTTVTSGVEKTNPFKADVNPYSGYKNPFAQ